MGDEATADKRSANSPGRGLKTGLTALGTAAVVGIYGAGYALTEDAARQLEERFGDGSEPPVSPGYAVSSEPVAPDSGTAATSVAVPADTQKASTPDPAPSGAEAASAPEVVQPAPVSAQATAAVASPASSPTPAPSSQAAAPSTAANAATPPASEAAAEAAPVSRFADGTYTAWGERTRHGDIQVIVVITDGRIVSAAVQSCGMRWPCSDINRLIPRVAQRQSTDVGIISGATQSSDAFQSAVRAALIQALPPAS